MALFASEKEKITIFVYGTLQRGGSNDINRFDPAPEWVGHGCLRGRLFDLGHCPAFILDEKGHLVWGEIYRIVKDHFTALDRWESQCGDFRLKCVEVMTKNGVVPCFIYESGASQVGRCSEVKTGRWPISRKLHEEQLFPVGDRAVMVDFSGEPQTHKLSMIHGFSGAVRMAGIHGIHDVVEAPESVTVHYAPELIYCDANEYPGDVLSKALLEIEIWPFTSHGAQYVIPVCYEIDFAPDLQDIAHFHGVTSEAFVNEHASHVYTVASLGFLPGFAYLEGLPDRFHTPRLATPRAKVPQGSVAIGNEFTGIYPEDSPGGWRIIGRTNVRLFNPSEPSPSLLKAGDQVSFKRISLAEFSQSV